MISSRYEKLFRENVVMTIEHLKLEIGRPRESILRDLKNMGYYSSYNERGKFYTLCSTPEFDGLGLWKYSNAYFSIRRTLLDTAEYLVSTSNAGYTHDELRQILGIGIQNSLHTLTITDKIVRRQIGAQYVYFGKESIGKQGEKRNAMPDPPIVRKSIKMPGVRSYPDMEPALVIDILIAALRGYDADSAALSYLHSTGSPVTAQQVTTVFRYYDIGKKNSPMQK
ncbi:MAG: hypothetical protein FWH57_13745 [Oscillospiraceae bacterium]|nr:hypothetical protein [Oscillospiraceae bacterium]